MPDVPGHHQVIRIHAQAPPKPAFGAPCNGCGVCCLAEPCPVGMLFSGRRHGACAVVAWVEAEQRYRCGLVVQPAVHLPRWVGRLPAPLPRWLGRGAARLAMRFIATGQGCDSDAAGLPQEPASSVGRGHP